MMFVFRNNTIERFFPKDYIFSGYGDISVIPTEIDGYVWFYQAPLKCDVGIASSEIEDFGKKFLYVAERIPKEKVMIAFTMDIYYSLQLCEKDHRLKLAVADYNRRLYELESIRQNIKVVDICDFTRQFPSADLIDWKYYFISQMGLNPKLSRQFLEWWKKKLDLIEYKRKKCIVLDLDNTLWGGILGEDGVNGIKIDGDYPGSAFLYFQDSLLQLKQAGVILAICSKNNEQDVQDAWASNPSIILKKESFVAYRINWNDKPSNIVEIAKELNIGLDSLVFIDDSPTERELVKQALPEVSVPDFPEHPYDLPAFVQRIVYDYFNTYQITSEDKNKTEQYKANAARQTFKESFIDIDSYIHSLGIRLTIQPISDSNIARMAQLSQKTNQFNLTTIRYTESDLRDRLAKGWRMWCVGVEDRFGDSGISGCFLADDSEIDSFLMSCRVLGKGIEFAFMKKVLVYMKDMGYKYVYATYRPSQKNMSVGDFYEKCGFSCEKEENGVKKYIIDLSTADLTISDCYTIIE